MLLRPFCVLLCAAPAAALTTSGCRGAPDRRAALGRPLVDRRAFAAASFASFAAVALPARADTLDLATVLAGELDALAADVFRRRGTAPAVSTAFARSSRNR